MAILLSYECEVATCGYSWWAGLPTHVVATNEIVNETWDPDQDLYEDACLYDNQGGCDDDVETVSVTLRDSALFLRIAAMQPTMEEIVELAKEYGPIFGDRIFYWEFEVRILKFMVELWQSVVAVRRTGFVAQHFKVDRSGNVSCPCRELTDPTLQALPFSQAFHGDTMRAMRRRHGRLGPDRGDHNFFVGTSIDGAREFLHRAFGIFLSHHHCKPAFRRRGRSYEIAFEPDSPASVIWLQFALAVAEDKRFRPCEVCGRSFELSPDVNRTSRVYCTNACRVKAYRQRKDKAQRLRAKGKTLREIAAQLGSTTETVKEWLKPDSSG